MSRSEGFDVMDVSTSILHDPKFVKLARLHPELAGDAFTAYSSTMAESWKGGQRLSVDEAWPLILTVNQAVIDALHEVRLLDAKGRVTLSAWREFFERARDRREKARDRWRRGNVKRATDHAQANGADSGAAAPSPRGRNAVTEANRTDSDSVTDSVGSSSLVSEPHRAREGGAEVEPELPWQTTTDRPEGTKSRPTRVDEILPRVAQGLRR